MEDKTQRSIGEYLRTFREEKGIMLREIAQKTCISEKYLEDVENDRFDDMGGIGYAKAITVTYAREIGANDKLVLHLFNSKYTKPVSSSLYRREQQPRKFMIPTSIFSILLLIILIVVLSVIIVRLYKGGDLSFPFRKSLETKKVEKANILKEPVKNALSIYDSLEEEKKAVRQSEIDVNAVKAVKVDLSALQDSTDYTDKYLFKGKESPFNVKE